jgi:hypothetical protein
MRKGLLKANLFRVLTKIAGKGMPKGRPEKLPRAAIEGARTFWIRRLALWLIAEVVTTLVPTALSSKSSQKQ